MISLSVNAGDREASYLGIPAKKLQDGIVIKDSKISGTLYKQEHFTAFNPGDPSEQTGHYLVLDLDAESGAEITTKMTGGSSKGEKVTVDDGFCVYLVKEPKEQKIEVKVTKLEEEVTRTYDLSGLVFDED